MRRFVAVRRLLASVVAGFLALATPAAFIAIMLVSACALAAAGVYLLLGLAWALIASAALLFMLAALLARGLTHG